MSDQFVTRKDLQKMQEENDQVLAGVVSGLKTMVDQSAAETKGQLDSISEMLKQALGAKPTAEAPAPAEQPAKVEEPATTSAADRVAGIFGKKELAEVPTPTPLAKAQEAATPAAVSIHEIGQRLLTVKASRQKAEEERRARMDQAYKDLLVAFTDAGLAFDHDAYADPQQEEGCREDMLAITWLQTQVANDAMTLEQALEYAVKAGWTRPLTAFEILLAELRKRGKRVVRIVSGNGTEINVHEELEKAVAAGEIVTVDDLERIATQYEWIRDYDPGRVTVRDKLEAERAAELDAMARREGGRGKHVGNRGKHTRGKGR